MVGVRGMAGDKRQSELAGSRMSGSRRLLSRPMAALFLPLLAAPLLAACADRGDQQEPCDRPVSCKERRPLPILY